MESKLRARLLRSISVAAVCAFMFGMTTILLAADGGDAELQLLKAYISLQLVHQVPTQVGGMTKGVPAPVMKQINTAVGDWVAGVTEDIRSDLETRFGSEARPKFEDFVGKFTSMEEAGDAAYLSALATKAGVTPAPKGYGEMRQAVITEHVSGCMDSGANLLSEIETWLDVRKKQKNVPPLHAWLTRNEAVEPSLVRKPHKPLDPLAAAEAGGDSSTYLPEEGTLSELELLSSARSERRKRTLAEAEAGMAQVATEREAAEREFAAKKMAAAQAEAEAMKSQAEKMAAIEKEAIEQRQHTFGGRLKRLVGATVSAAGGAFMGGVGARAGEEAVTAVFGK